MIKVSKRIYFCMRLLAFIPCQLQFFMETNGSQIDKEHQ